MFAIMGLLADNANDADSMRTTDSLAQFITVLVVFVLVLALTLWTTRFMAKYQKGQKTGSNIEVVETSAIGNGKYIQIVKIAEKYVAIAVCKDTVTLLAEIPKEGIVFPPEGNLGMFQFKELLHKAKSSYTDENSTKVEDSLKEE